MSRDPLEGYRPSDTAGPSFAPALPVTSALPIPPAPVSSGSPIRGSKTKVVLIVFITVAAMFAGVAAFFLTAPHGALAPKAQPSAKPTGDVVKQGPAPAEEPPPAPIATPK